MKTIILRLHLIAGLILLSGFSSFAYDFKDGDFYYNILSETDGTAEITRQSIYNNDDYRNLTELTIPSEATYNSKAYKVVAIGDGAFSYCTELTDVTVPNSVGTIGEFAFSYCYKLSTITLGNSVTTIGNNAFFNCFRLTSIDLPNTVTAIGDGAFCDCNGLTSVNIPDNVTVIGDATFRSCSSLRSISIPESVTSIGNEAFSRCINLKSFIIGNAVTTIGDYAFSWCYSLASLTIGSSVTTIGSHAFHDCGLVSVDIPVSVTTIGDYTFYNCGKLTSINIPNSVTTIGSQAFSRCQGLTSISIPNSVTTIGDKVFFLCVSLLEIIVDESNPNYSSIDGVLYDKNVSTLICCPSAKETVTIPDKVSTIKENAFTECTKLNTVIIPSSVTSIGDEAFYGCIGLTSINIPNSVISIGDDVFYGCESMLDVNIDEANPVYSSIDGVVYDKNVTFLIFCPAAKESLIIPDTVTTIDNSAFSNCFYLTTLTIGKSVSDFGHFGFCNCFSLTTIYCRINTPPTTHKGIFTESTYETGKLYVPTGCKSAYESTYPWGIFPIEEMDYSGINELPEDADEPRLSIENGMLKIDGIEGDESVLIYDMRGRMVYNGTANDIPDISRGIYIVKVGKYTAKFAI